jgi:ABC-type Mn2+/Zn2+ transport system permease subunit
MAEAHGVDLVSGNLLYTMGDEILLLSLLAVGTLSLHLILFPRFLYVSFDPETARTLGLGERVVEFLMYLTLGLCIAGSMKTTGILFVFSSMVIPPMVGLVLCRRVWAVFVIAVAAAMAAGFLGLWASFAWDLPTGPTIVCVEGVLFLLAALVRVLR